MLGGDIRIKWNSTYNQGDFSIDDTGADLSTDEGLETAVVISLFTDRRAVSEELPAGEKRLKGWWGDSFADIPNDKIGSKLWLLSREKELQCVAVKAKEYAEDALKWLIEDKIVLKVEVEAELLGSGKLGLLVKIYRPNSNTSTEYRYNYNWQAQEAINYAV